MNLSLQKDDLALASNNKVNFIKLKLFKQGGIKETIEIAEAAKAKNKYNLRKLVATYISNFIENQIFLAHPDYFLPLESNGFKKINKYYI